MKKKLALFVLMMVVLSTSSVCYAAEANCVGDDKPVYDVVYIEEDDDVLDVPTESLIDNSESESSQPYGTAITYTWKIESKKLVNDEYPGAWQTLHQVKISKKDAPQDIDVKVEKNYKNSYSGTLKVTYKTLTAKLGFDAQATTSVDVRFKKSNASAGTWYCKARPIYKRYKVVQRSYQIGAGSSGKPMKEKKTLMVNKFDHYETTLTKTK